MPPLYSTDHTWIDASDPAHAVVGISPHAQDTLGDIVFVELPALDAHVAQGTPAGVAESVKAASDVVAPASGTVVAVNEALRADPSLANSEPLGAGWFYAIRLDEPAALSHLLDDAAYAALLSSS